MGRLGPRPNRQKDQNDDRIKDKYKTELIIRPKCEDFVKQTYNTTPVDKHCPKKHQDKKKDDPGTDNSPQFEYIKRNLCVKTCLGSGEQILRFQVKKVTIRNYTPKILNQEINMGMWM